jgi:DNA-binding NarL/FixJ family response regulator
MVFQLLAEGKTTKEIAFNLNISIKTVETHRQHVMNKLDMHNSADIIKLAIREGIISHNNIN